MDIANIDPEFSSLLNESILFTDSANKSLMRIRIAKGEALPLLKTTSSIGLTEEKLNPCLSYLSAAIRIEGFVAILLYILGTLKALCAIVGSQLLPWSFAAPFGCCFSLMWSTVTLYNILREPELAYRYKALSMGRITNVYNRNVEHINKCFTYITEHPEDKVLNGTLFAYACKIAELFKSVDIPYIDCFVKNIEDQVEKALLPDSEPNNIKSILGPLSIFPYGEDPENNTLHNGIKRAFCLTYRISEHCTEGNKEINPLHKKREYFVDKIWVQALPIALFLVSAFILPYHALTIACSVLVLLVMVKQNKQLKKNERRYKDAIELDNMVSQYLLYRPTNSPIAHNQYLISSRENLINVLSVEVPSEIDLKQCPVM